MIYFLSKLLLPGRPDIFFSGWNFFVASSLEVFGFSKHRSDLSFLWSLKLILVLFRNITYIYITYTLYSLEIYSAGQNRLKVLLCPQIQQKGRALPGRSVTGQKESCRSCWLWAKESWRTLALDGVQELTARYKSCPWWTEVSRLHPSSR